MVICVYINGDSSNLINHMVRCLRCLLRWVADPCGTASRRPTSLLGPRTSAACSWRRCCRAPKSSKRRAESSDRAATGAEESQDLFKVIEKDALHEKNILSYN